ncbi:hypothetical protein GEV33_000729 [Tenebrio molitor]|uniref:Uncharacterized protein n=1 Tax=Tenebrio molitor TaxID=7067 RepID=A0A8J6HWY2_TENMO|nr:hypothetical protein GEV33_000997 [Tenebrio molitor]KAH0822062.1 hypothetical protein GEV33_000729 [Tenebrio molitor]
MALWSGVRPSMSRALGLAPRFRRSSSVSEHCDRAARCKGVCFLWFSQENWAPASIRRRAHSASPSSAARWSGVSLSVPYWTLTAAPWLNRRATISEAPKAAAT